MTELQTYAVGDWIAHAHYGVGQIEAIEAKNLSGSKTSYFRVKTAGSTFWIPVKQMNSALLRPLSTPEQIKEVTVVLNKPARIMSSNAKIRQSRIHSVRLSNTPSDVARLIRDLRARQRDKGILYSTERGAFRALKEQLAQEWAIVTGSESEAVTAEIDSLLNKHRTAIAAEEPSE